MKFLCALSLLLGLQLCAPQPQAQKKGGPSAGVGPAASAPASESSPVAARTVICIDPGHPSEVASGMTAQNGTNETRVAWEVALRLKRILEAEGYEVVLTKSAEGELVRNRDRALVANRARAALMVRLHCDASIESGFAVYYPDRRGQTKDGTSGPSPSVIEESRRAAEAVRAGMAEGLAGALRDNGVRTDYQTKVGREQGGALTGSIFSEVPVVTVEMVVLSDPDDAEFIKAEAGQQRMAEAIADGITRFVGPTPAALPRKD
ncbi:MAG TPA: N-acetylmuramoyl-L-alanine amidase [Pyrinomonadaceae bacterium]|nr:N-acetylmuramoyl-L-alanine amidase [Pyrinomonadaceae bacterium]